MAEEGATPVPKSTDPKDACPRVNGNGPHKFEWIEFSEDQVRCINCGQIRRRTRAEDTVVSEGVVIFPAVPVEDPPTAVELPTSVEQEVLASPPPIVAAAPADSYAGGGASGSYDSGSSDSGSSSSSSDGGSSSSGSD